MTGATLDLGPSARAARRSLGGEHAGETGIALPPFIDHHVHLMLVPRSSLRDSALAGVVDLGAPLPLVGAELRRDGMPRLDVAGNFITARGGYPVGRPWAAPGCARELDPEPADDRAWLPGAAETAVREQHSFGASVIKVALNRVAGPVLDRPTLDAVVGTAHDLGLPVVAHVEGDDMTRLAVDAGVDVLAHTPFTEVVDDGLIARAVAAGQRWISTLFVAGYGEATPDAARAADNLGRFHRAGGRVLYGTDLGNGDQPAGLNAAELALLLGAGLAASDVIDALADPWPRAEPPQGVTTFIAGEPPADADRLPDWMASARVVPAEDLEYLAAPPPLDDPSRTDRLETL